MNWRKWIRPALAVTIIATPVAILLEKGDIESDLAGRVTRALSAGGQDWAKVSASARDVVVSGTAPAVDSQQAAIRIAGGVEGVRTVANQTVLLPVAAPYVWSARRSGGQVALSGSVPSESVRAVVLATARRALPQAEIVDRMSLARGAPATFGPATGFALGRLAGLSEGLITLTDSTMSVTGTAADAIAYADFRGGLAKDLPASVDTGPIDVLPAKASRFVWSINLDAASVTVAGNVPNDVVRQALAAAIKASQPGVPFVEAVTVASGDPPGFGDAAAFAISQLQHLRRGGITLDGLAFDLAGEAKSVDDYAALMASLGGALPEGVKVVAAEVVPAAVTPYLWQAEINDGKVTLSGYAPSVDWRSQLAAFARSTIPGGAVDDQVKIARGEPRMDWVGAVKFAIGQLGLVGRGSVSISETGYSISGEAKDAKSYAAIVDQNSRTLPAGLVLKSANLLPPRVTPYRFSAERRDGRVVVAGYVARDEDRQAILAAARRVPGSTEVTDSLIFASGAPAGFVTAATSAVRSLTRLAGGKADIVDQAVTLNGTAFQEAAVSQIGDALRDGLPPGFSLARSDVFVGEPGQPITAVGCRESLQTLLKAGRIEFDANNPVVTTDSLGVLDRVAATMLRCPTAAIEVGVHSDNDGTPAALRDRTQARADAIVDYLAGAGVRRERLTGVGYGQTKPIADNATAAGKASNRRVEFTVAGAPGG